MEYKCWKNILDLIIHLKIFSIQWGHLKDPSDSVHTDNRINFNTEQFMDRYQNGFNEYAFQFTGYKFFHYILSSDDAYLRNLLFLYFFVILAGTRKYEAIIKLRKKCQRTLYGGYPWDSEYVFCNFELRLNNTPGM